MRMRSRKRRTPSTRRRRMSRLIPRKASQVKKLSVVWQGFSSACITTWCNPKEFHHCSLPLTLPSTVRFLPQMANSAGTRLGRQHWTESAPDSINWKNSNDDDDRDDGDDDDGLPAYSHHDKIPPWWGNVNNDKGGKISVTKSHHTRKILLGVCMYQSILYNNGRLPNVQFSN